MRDEGWAFHVFVLHADAAGCSSGDARRSCRDLGASQVAAPRSRRPRGEGASDQQANRSVWKTCLM